MVQKASRGSTQADRLRQHGSSIKSLQGLNRLRTNPAQISIGGNTAPQSAGGVQTSAGNFLHTSGDTMIGPIAFYPVDVIIDGSGIINIGEGVSTPSDYSSYVLCAGAGNPDDLDQIKGIGFSGQYLALQGTTATTINVRNYTASAGGNIITPNGGTIQLIGANIIELFFDITISPNGFNGGWRVVQGGGGGSGVSFPITPPIHDYGSIGGGTQNLDLSLSNGHIHKFTLTGNETLTFSNPPATGFQMTFEVEVLQDATGGRTLTWPASVVETVTIDSGANKLTIVSLRTNDGGTKYHAITLISGTTGGGGGGATTLDELTDVTITTAAIYNHLEYNGSQWVNVANILMAGNITPTTSGTRTLGALTSTGYFANIYTGTLNLGDNVDNQTLLGVSTGIEYNVLTGDSHLFKVNGVSKFQVHGSANVTYQSILPNTGATRDLGDSTTYFANLFIGTVNFGDSGNNETIIGVPTGLEYNVKTGDTHSFRVNGVENINVDTNGIHFNNLIIFALNQIQFFDGHTITTGVDSLALGANTNDDITINTTTIQAEFDGDTNTLLLNALTSTTASDGMALELMRVDTTPFDGDTSGAIKFKGKNEAASTIIFAEIDGIMRDVSTATEDGEVWFFIQKAGVLTSQFVISAGKVSTQGGNLDMVGGDIINLDDIQFNVAGTTILNYTDGLDFNVPTGDFYRYFINGVLIYDVKTTGIKMDSAVGVDIDLNGNDLLNVDLITGSSSQLAYIDMNQSVGSIYIDTGQASKSISLLTNGVIQISISDTQILTSQDVLFTTGKNLVFDTGTGSKIGTGTTQKIGFWNHAPVVQQTVGSDTLANLYTALRASGILG